MSTIRFYILLFVAVMFSACATQEETVIRHGKEASAYFDIGYFQAIQKNYGEAYATLISVEDAVGAKATKVLGDIAVLTGDYVSAEGYYRKLLLQQPDPLSTVNLAYLFEKDHKSFQAKLLLLVQSRKDPSNVDLQVLVDLFNSRVLLDKEDIPANIDSLIEYQFYQVMAGITPKSDILSQRILELRRENMGEETFGECARVLNPETEAVEDSAACLNPSLGIIHPRIVKNDGKLEIQLVYTPAAENDAIVDKNVDSEALLFKPYAIEIMNGEGSIGLARRTRDWLAQYQVKVDKTTDKSGDDQARTEIHYQEGYKYEARHFASFFPMEIPVLRNKTLNGDIQVRLILGKDFDKSILE